MIDAMIVTYNSAAVLPALSHSVRKSSNSIGRVWICDNNSADRSADLARDTDWGCETRVVVSESNVGFGRAHNQIAYDASGTGGSDFLLVVNPDVSFEPETLDRMLEVIASDPGIGCVGARLSTSGGKPVSSARRFPDFGSLVSGRPQDVTGSVETDVDWVCGAFMLLRREAFDAVGGFHDGYFLYFEDVDLCRSMIEMGWRVVYCGNAEAIHDQGHGRPTSGALQKISRQSRRLYCARWLPWPQRWAWWISDRVDDARRVKAAIESLRGSEKDRV